jgi:hypothetical protein
LRIEYPAHIHTLMKLKAKWQTAKQLREAPGRDQLEDYAARKGMTLELAEKWLAPNLED